MQSEGGGSSLGAVLEGVLLETGKTRSSCRALKPVGCAIIPTARWPELGGRVGKFPDGAHAVMNDFSSSGYQGPGRGGETALLAIRCFQFQMLRVRRGRIAPWITDGALLGPDRGSACIKLPSLTKHKWMPGSSWTLGTPALPGLGSSPSPHLTARVTIPQVPTDFRSQSFHSGPLAYALLTF